MSIETQEGLPPVGARVWWDGELGDVCTGTIEVYSAVVRTPGGEILNRDLADLHEGDHGETLQTAVLREDARVRVSAQFGASVAMTECDDTKEALAENRRLLVEIEGLRTQRDELQRNLGAIKDLYSLEGRRLSNARTSADRLDADYRSLQADHEDLTAKYREALDALDARDTGVQAGGVVRLWSAWR